jgi:hypothetical protein
MADIYNNARREKIHKKNRPGPGFKGTEKAGKAAEAEAPCPGRPAGRDPHRGSDWTFGPYFRGAYFFPFSGKKRGGA